MKDIPEFRLIPEPVTKEAADLVPFRWASPEIGKRHQIGGRPHAMSDGDWPYCSSCERKMRFYGQLDSINDEYCIADCGLIYVFICFECLETKSIVQTS